jgi:hypothetical protein
MAGGEVEASAQTLFPKETQQGMLSFWLGITWLLKD